MLPLPSVLTNRSGGYIPFTAAMSPPQPVPLPDLPVRIGRDDGVLTVLENAVRG